MAPPRVVGFDLDMTLVDSADSIIEAITHVCRSYGVVPDPDDVRDTIGLPLESAFPRWMPDAPIDDLVAAYRAYYAVHGIPATRPMPGAVDLLAALADLDITVLVVTAKLAEVGAAALAAAGLVADDVVGGLFGPAKAGPLRAFGAEAYIGDHVGDVQAARLADALAVGVATGPTPAAALHAAGADVVLADLTGVLPVLAERVGPLGR